MNGSRSDQIYSSHDGLAWKGVSDVFTAGAAYSDLTITQQGNIGVVFERGPSDRDPYGWLTFGKVPAPAASRP